MRKLVVNETSVRTACNGENHAKKNTEMVVVVVMGVSGCGKSSVGSAIAALWGGKFFDGDDYHPIKNKDKVRTNIVVL